MLDKEVGNKATNLLWSGFSFAQAGPFIHSDFAFSFGHRYKKRVARGEIPLAGMEPELRSGQLSDLPGFRCHDGFREGWLSQHQVWIGNPSVILLMRGWLSGLFCFGVQCLGAKRRSVPRCTPSFQSSNISCISNSEICYKWLVSRFESELKHHL